MLIKRRIFRIRSLVRLRSAVAMSCTTGLPPGSDGGAIATRVKIVPMA